MRAELKDDWVEISFRYDRTLIDAVKCVPGRQWDSERKIWLVPKRNIAAMMAIIGKYAFTFSPEILKLSGANQNQFEEIPDVQLDYEFKTKPYKHQKFGIAVALDHLQKYGCTGLLWEMGTGKTLAALAIADILRQRLRVSKTLVICPASLIDNWETEAQQHASFTVSKIIGTKVKRLNALSFNADLHIVNYDYVTRILPQLLERKFDLIVCDESTRIKTPTAKVSKSVWKLGNSARFRIIMTGTPITQSPVDAFSQFRFLDSNIFGWNFYQFRERYCIMGGYGSYQVLGYQNLEALKDTMQAHTTRFLKKQCLDLPEKVFEKRAVEMGKEQKQKYDDMAALILKEIEDEFGNLHRVSAKIALVKMLRLQQITSGHLKTVDGKTIEFGSAKDEVIEEILEDQLYNGNKVIIWARFIAEIKKLIALCTDKGYNPVAIWGDIPMGDRSELVNRFQRDDSVRVFIGQIATAGFGLTLTSASTAIYYSQDWSLEHYLQSQDRNHRIGAKGNSITYISLYCKKTIDEAVQKALDKKRSLADTVTGDNSLLKITRGEIDDREN